MNDPQVTRYLDSGRFPAQLDDLHSYYQSFQNNPHKIIFAVCDAKNDLHIGNITLNDIHPVHRRAVLGLMIGDKAYWGRGVGTETTRLLVGYGFARLNLNSIALGVAVENIGAIRAYEKVGFTIDGTDRQAWWIDGRYHDLHRMSILHSEYDSQQAAAHPPTASTTED